VKSRLAKWTIAVANLLVVVAVTGAGSKWA
jgi:hypothetical protein